MHRLLCLFHAHKMTTSPDLAISEVGFTHDFGISVSSRRSLETERNQVNAFQTCLRLGPFHLFVVV